MSAELENLAPAEFSRALERTPRPRLVDVREEEEWVLCRIEGAEWMPLSRFVEEAPARLAAQEPVLLYCHHGVRSGHAGQWLLERGHRSVGHLRGGIDAWSRDVDPAVPRY